MPPCYATPVEVQASLSGTGTGKSRTSESTELGHDPRDPHVTKKSNLPETLTQAQHTEQNPSSREKFKTLRSTRAEFYLPRPAKSVVAERQAESRAVEPSLCKQTVRETVVVIDKEAKRAQLSGEL